MNDATWIADLLAHGLIGSSCVPPAPIQELRDLTRTRRQLVHEVARHVLRIQKGSWVCAIETQRIELVLKNDSLLGCSIPSRAPACALRLYLEPELAGAGE